jgi:hypothetical protein
MQHRPQKIARTNFRYISQQGQRQWKGSGPSAKIKLRQIVKQGTGFCKSVCCGGQMFGTLRESRN